MKKIVFFLSALTLCFLTNACSTMQGLGNDVQKAGSAISTSAERASEE